MCLRHALPIALAVGLGSPPAGALEPPPAPAATDPWDVVQKIIGLRNRGELAEAVALARGAFDAAGSDTDLRRTIAREGKDVAVKLFERDRGRPKQTEAAISALCWAIETMRTYQAELMTTERDRLTIPAEVVRLESLATGLAAPCLAKDPEPPPADAASTGAGALPAADPRPVSAQREGPEPPAAPTGIRRTRPQITIGSTLLLTGAGLAAGFAGCYVASGHERARILALGARAEEAGRDPTNEEWAEAATADARAIRLTQTGTALGVFAVASVLAGIVVLMVPRRSTSRVQARPVGPGVRINF